MCLEGNSSQLFVMKTRHTALLAKLVRKPGRKKPFMLRHTHDTFPMNWTDRRS